MSQAHGIVIVTGVGPFSLGEEIVRLLLTLFPHTTVLGLDIIPNPRLLVLARYQHVQMDLNPLVYSGNISAFSSKLSEVIDESLRLFKKDFVAALIQSAGVYDAGALTEHDHRRRTRLLGLNLLGHIELLHTVMSGNVKRGFNNADHLISMEIGSFQGLYPRRHRSLYAVSKAAQIDLYTALSDGNELRRCLYIAPGLIDTHMLHRNHWVYKANGSAAFFDQVFQKAITEYQHIYQDCNRSVFNRVIDEVKEHSADLLRAFESYAAVRQAAFRSEDGVASPKEVAHMALTLLRNEQYLSGIYYCRMNQKMQYAAFNELLRGDNLIHKGKQLAL